MTLNELRALLFPSGSRSIKKKKLFELLSDQNWHCKACAQKDIGFEQIAGGSGLSGLRNGTRGGVGLKILKKRLHCDRCGGLADAYRWTGETHGSVTAAPMSIELKLRILAHYGYRDSVEERELAPSNLTIDHRVPMIRWGTDEPDHPLDASSEYIAAHFQLLKKESGSNHNQLKSRACEKCLKTGKRGTPFGIKHFYSGGEDWPSELAAKGPAARAGCVGCGWYDFQKWRESLNERIGLGPRNRKTAAKVR